MKVTDRRANPASLSRACRAMSKAAGGSEGGQCASIETTDQGPAMPGDFSRISAVGPTEPNGLRPRLASDPVDVYWTSGSEAIILSLSRIPCKFKTGNAMLTEAQWRRIYAFLCDHAGVDAHWRLFKEVHCRLFVEAVCWMARNDASWRMLPAEYGKWNSVYQRYTSWEKKRHLAGSEGACAGGCGFVRSVAEERDRKGAVPRRARRASGQQGDGAHMNAYRAWYRSLPPYRKFFFAFGVCLPIAAVGYGTSYERQYLGARGARS